MDNDARKEQIARAVALKAVVDLYGPLSTSDVDTYLPKIIDQAALFEAYLLDDSAASTAPSATATVTPVAQPAAPADPAAPAPTMTPEQVMAYMTSQGMVATPVTGTGPAPGEKLKGRALVDDIIANPGNYWNNIGDSRATTGGGRGPDFKLKSDPDQALWVNGQYPVDGIEAIVTTYGLSLTPDGKYLKV